MDRILRCTLVLMAAIGGVALCQASSHAETTSPVIKGIAQPIAVDERLVGTMYEGWASLTRQAIQGNCLPIEQALADDRYRGTTGPVVARAQLLDHGLCLQFDPVAAYAEIATLEAYYPGTVSLWRGWKSYYGHGLPKADEASVKQDFLRYLLSISWRSLDSDDPSPANTTERIGAQVRFDLGARAVPPVLADGVDWLKEQLADRPKRLNLARSMIWGGGTYTDGTPLPEALSGRDAEMFVSTLSFLYAEANVMKAKALIQGLFPDVSSDGWEVQHLLRRAANCLNYEAILLMIRLGSTGALPGGYTQKVDDYEMLRYVMLARALHIPEEKITGALDGKAVESNEDLNDDINRILNRHLCNLL